MNIQDVFLQTGGRKVILLVDVISEFERNDATSSYKHMFSLEMAHNISISDKLTRVIANGNEMKLN